MGKSLTCNEKNASSSLAVSTITDGQGKKRAAVLIECDGCGSPFLIARRFLARSKRHYCSTTCPGRRVGELVICAYCKTEFYCRPAKIKRSKTGLLFCKRECKDAAQRLTSHVNLRPDHYGKIGQKTLGELKRALRQWRNVVAGDARRVASYLGGDCCEICGYTTYTEVCHIKPVSEFEDATLVSQVNSPDNLAILCPNHHKELDLGILDLGLLVRVKNGFSRDY